MPYPSGMDDDPQANRRNAAPSTVAMAENRVARLDNPQRYVYRGVWEQRRPLWFYISEILCPVRVTRLDRKSGWWLTQTDRAAVHGGSILVRKWSNGVALNHPILN